MCLGIPGQLLEVANPESHMAVVQLSGARRMVDVSLLEDTIAPGDWILVHAGLALSAISEREAHETLALLQEMSELFLGDAPDAPSTT